VSDIDQTWLVFKKKCSVCYIYISTGSGFRDTDSVWNQLT